MPDYEAWTAGSNEQKMKIAAINLKNNPHIAAYQFMDRFQSYMDKVITQKFDVVDSCVRGEMGNYKYIILDEKSMTQSLSVPPNAYIP
ncbi:hypothetical protein E4U16_002403 [Claviceps sp. LM84 group G4]|nr:hypothetical protein E4U33_002042 [Claviceps sp. LM78 group G4]KAG6077135.1 hypothetical protein E4U16_002403 [Claviceps sp. LM84 group G4]